MKAVTMLLAAFCVLVSNVEACVTYNPSTGTYTVDHQGCVDHGGGQKTQPKPAKTQKSPSKSNKK